MQSTRPNSLYFILSWTIEKGTAPCRTCSDNNMNPPRERREHELFSNIAVSVGNGVRQNPVVVDSWLLLVVT